MFAELQGNTPTTSSGICQPAFEFAGMVLVADKFTV